MAGDESAYVTLFLDPVRIVSGTESEAEGESGGDPPLIGKVVNVVIDVIRLKEERRVSLYARGRSQQKIRKGVCTRDGATRVVPVNWLSGSWVNR